MKRLLFVFLILALLAGCGQQAAPAASIPLIPPAGGYSPLVPSPMPAEKEPQVGDVLKAYEQAAEYYDWFDLAPMPAAGAPVVEDGETYLPMSLYPESEYIRSVADLRAKLESVFTPELAEQVFALAPGQYRDIDGRLYVRDGGRGSNLYLLGKTVEAERVNEDLWTVTLTFWAEYEETRMVTLPDSGSAWPSPVAIAGYSTETLRFERTDAGWLFTNFCPSDALDLDADTVYTFDYYQDFEVDSAYLDYSDWQLVCYLIHADGAYAEAPFDLLYQRFLERPNDILAALALLDSSPYREEGPEYLSIDYLVTSPGYSAISWYPDALEEFEDALSRCTPANGKEEAALKKIRIAYEDAMAREYATVNNRFSLTVPGTAVFTLGPQEGVFPWGLELDCQASFVSPAMDGSGPCFQAELEGLTLFYTLSPEDGREHLLRMTAIQPGIATDDGVAVGDLPEKVYTLYPDTVLTDSDPEYDGVIIWEPGGHAYCKHIAFFLREGVVAEIEVEDLLDGRLLD